MKGRGVLILAFVLLIGMDLTTRMIWFSKFGFQPSKLVLVVISGVLFFYAYQGSPVARWITVACGVLGLLLAISWKLYEHELGLGLIGVVVTIVILLCLPQVGEYQEAARKMPNEPV